MTERSDQPESGPPESEPPEGAPPEGARADGARADGDLPEKQAHDHSNDPLHGITLKAMLQDLVGRRGWNDLSYRIRIRCFEVDPSFGSSLKFLRRTPWARDKVERLYARDHGFRLPRKKWD